MNFRLVLLSLLSVVFFSACKKQSDNVFLTNEGTIGFDGYSFTDSLSLWTSTVREDSLKTDSLSHNLLGVINDPVLGRSEAASFFQFKLPQLNKVIRTETLDSAVLIIQFTSATAYYGDLNAATSFKVYELTEDMKGTVTHSNQGYSYDALKPVGSFSGKLRLSDSLSITELGNTVKVAPGIAIRLSAEFAQRLFDADNNQLSSSDNFLQYIKGLAIVPDANPAIGSGVIAAINMQGTFSKIRVHYNGNLQSDFRVIDGARRFTRYTVNGQSSEVMRQKANPKSNFDTVFVQAMAGAKTHIRIPHLFGVIQNNQKKISVGKAELIIRPLAGSYASPFTLPSRLLLLQPNPENNLNAGIIDLLEPFYGGSYNAVSNEYRFNITRHIQSLFSDYQLRGKNSNLGFFLITPSDFPIAPARMVVDARKKISNSGVEFKLVYTEL